VVVLLLIRSIPIFFRLIVYKTSIGLHPPLAVMWLQFGEIDRF